MSARAALTTRIPNKLDPKGVCRFALALQGVTDETTLKLHEEIFVVADLKYDEWDLAFLCGHSCRLAHRALPMPLRGCTNHDVRQMRGMMGHHITQDAWFTLIRQNTGDFLLIIVGEKVDLVTEVLAKSCNLL